MKAKGRPVTDPRFLKTILVALDDSVRAAGVFDAAVELATQFGATLHLIRAITIPPEFPPAAAASHADELPAHLERMAIEQLSALIRRAPNVAIAAPIVATGPQPWRLILENARRLDADLIVLGSHGYGGWDRVLGTTAGKVANLADRNVLVVHARDLDVVHETESR